MMNQLATTQSSHWPQLIMVHGLMESGKSTLASYLIEEHGYRRVKFADTLKNMIRHILRYCGISDARIEDYLEGDLKKSAIPELNDHALPKYRLENLPDDFIMELVVGLLCDAGLSGDQLAFYLAGQDVPIAELRGVTTVRRLFDTLRNDWSRQMLRGEIVTCRRMMQTLGEEWRNLHSNKLWAYISLSMSEVLFAAGHRVVIDDNRYRFEFDPFAHLLYFRFVVTRGDRHFLPVSPDTHQSEIPMPVEWFHAHLKNDFTIQHLRDHARIHLDAYASYRQVAAIVQGEQYTAAA